MTGRRSPLALGALLVSVGLLHLTVPRLFAHMIPSVLGPARFWVAISGLAEVASGAALLRPSTQRAGGWAAAATLVAVFPGNVKMALDAGLPASAWSAALWLRLPLQIPLVAWAVRCARLGGGGAATPHDQRFNDCSPSRSRPTSSSDV